MINRRLQPQTIGRWRTWASQLACAVKALGTTIHLNLQTYCSRQASFILAVERVNARTAGSLSMPCSTMGTRCLHGCRTDTDLLCLYCCDGGCTQIPAHPEYPSGHTFTVGAVLEVLKRTLNGKDDVSMGGSSPMVECLCLFHFEALCAYLHEPFAPEG